MDGIVGKTIEMHRLVDTLAQLHQYETGDGNLISALIEDYLESTPPTVTSMRDACQELDLEALRDQAHSLKSVSATSARMGLPRFVPRSKRKRNGLTMLAPSWRRLKPNTWPFFRRCAGKKASG